jgi:peptidyl-prolyl cis-trans isomerase C
LQQNSYAIQAVYTIQTGSFESIDDAHKQFSSIVQELNDIRLDNLRIEKIGDFYSVRLGKFKAYSKAEQLNKAITPHFSQSYVLKAYITDERIVHLYKESSFEDNRDQEESLPVSVTKKVESQEPEKADEKIKFRISAEALERKGDIHAGNGSSFLAIEEYNQALKQGTGNPILHWKLSLLLYQTGFVEKAVVEMEKAAAISPDLENISIELGKLYFASNRLEMAKEQFISVLEMNPGYASIYYYLTELFIRLEDYNMAWMSFDMARRLGFRSQETMKRLRASSKEPDIDPVKSSEEDLYIRQILVDTYDKAQDLKKLISEGELFEDIAKEKSKGANAERGGFMGHFKPSELHPKISKTLLARGILANPVIVETENGFHIVQRILPFALPYNNKTNITK